MIFIYTEDEPERRLVSASGQSPENRATVFAEELTRRKDLGVTRVDWLSGGLLGVPEYFAVAVAVSDATQRHQMPAELLGFKLREEGFDPAVLPQPADQPTGDLDEP